MQIILSHLKTAIKCGDEVLIWDTDHPLGLSSKALSQHRGQSKTAKINMHLVKAGCKANFDETIETKILPPSSG